MNCFSCPHSCSLSRSRVRSGTHTHALARSCLPLLDVLDAAIGRSPQRGSNAGVLPAYAAFRISDLENMCPDKPVTGLLLKSNSELRARATESWNALRTCFDLQPIVAARRASRRLSDIGRTRDAACASAKAGGCHSGLFVFFGMITIQVTMIRLK